MVVHIGSSGNCTWLGGWLLKERRERERGGKEKRQMAHKLSDRGHRAGLLGELGPGYCC